MNGFKKITHCLFGRKRQKGAATVELAFAMMALFIFFAIFMVFVEIFIAQERSIFSGFTAARTYMVKGEAPAFNAAVSVDPEVSVDISGMHVEITKHIPIAAGLDEFLTQGKGRFTFTYRSPTAREPRLNDDNPFPY